MFSSPREANAWTWNTWNNVMLSTYNEKDGTWTCQSGSKCDIKNHPKGFRYGDVPQNKVQGYKCSVTGEVSSKYAECGFSDGPMGPHEKKALQEGTVDNEYTFLS